MNHVLQGVRSSNAVQVLTELNAICSALDVVEISGKYLDVQQSLMLTFENQRELAVRLSEEFDIGVARQADWHTKEGLVRSLVAMVEARIAK